jgi:hypothetical protein
MSRKTTYALPNIISPANPVIFNLDVCTGCNHCVEAASGCFIPTGRKEAPVILHG